MNSKWKLNNTASINTDFLQAAHNDSLLARLLVNRSVNNTDLVKYFLDLDSVSPSHSFEIPEMDKAFERIKLAIASQQQILIFGDYDVDGTSSVALLFRAFGMIGVTVSYYVPSRHSEGYGLNKAALERFKNDGVDLVITCDCGISNYDEVAFANSIGLDVIVTDHHSIPENPPPSVANCNPKTLAQEHPLHFLPGVGVAYKLAELLIAEYTTEKPMAKVFAASLLDLVALGIIADLAPLQSENRYLAIKGLKVLARTKKPGLQKLLEISGHNSINVDSEKVGFGIAPRINAAGRLADALNAVKLMITDDIEEAERLTQRLDTENKERQALCEECFEEALDLIDQTVDLKTTKVLALAKEGWHHGVIGIVASRLVEKFHLPVFIMAIEENITKGSVRGINVSNLDVFDEMSLIQKEFGIFKKFGGHKMAAGFSCELADTTKLVQVLQSHFQKRLQGQDLTRIIKIDSSLFLDEVNEAFIKRIEKLSPYGIENPQPVFCNWSS